MSETPCDCTHEKFCTKRQGTLADGFLCRVESGDVFLQRGPAAAPVPVASLSRRLGEAEARCARLQAENDALKSALREISETYQEWGTSPNAPDFDAASDQLGAMCNAIQDAAALLGPAPGSPATEDQTHE